MLHSWFLMNQKPPVNITFKTIINSKVVPVLTLNLVTGNWSRSFFSGLKLFRNPLFSD